MTTQQSNQHKANLEKLYKKINDETGYIFNNHSILETQNLERLEFLGDCVLKLFLTQNLYKNLPYDNEGQLTQKRSFIECNKNLSLIYDTFDMFDFKKYGIIRIPKKNKKKYLEQSKKSIKRKADNIEVLIGAIYIDIGYDMRKVEPYFMKLFQESFEKVGSEKMFAELLCNLERNKSDDSADKENKDKDKMDEYKYTFEEIQEITQAFLNKDSTDDYCQCNIIGDNCINLSLNVINDINEINPKNDENSYSERDYKSKDDQYTKSSQNDVQTQFDSNSILHKHVKETNVSKINLKNEKFNNIYSGTNRNEDYTDISIFNDTMDIENYKNIIHHQDNKDDDINRMPISPPHNYKSEDNNSQNNSKYNNDYYNLNNIDNNTNNIDNSDNTINKVTDYNQFIIDGENFEFNEETIKQQEELLKSYRR